jgi:hypothetical protein
MEKDNILQKAQQHKEDERYTHTVFQSAFYTMIVLFVTMLFFIVWRLIQGESITEYGVILLSQVVAFSWYQYVKLPERKIYLFAMVFGSFFFVVLLIVYLAEYGIFS